MAKLEIIFEEIDGFVKIRLQTELQDSSIQEKILARTLEQDIETIMSGVEISGRSSTLKNPPGVGGYKQQGERGKSLTGRLRSILYDLPSINTTYCVFPRCGKA